MGVTMNKKLKWKYDKKFKQWYITESEPYANDGATIDKTQIGYKLLINGDLIHYFNKLSSAKEVGRLIQLG